jgi:LuxR family transcriptional regulator, maltose regulon positive regulatory protein
VTSVTGSNRVVAEELRVTAAADEWPRVIELVQSHWPVLLFGHPGTLARVLRSVPVPIVARYPLLLALLELLGLEAAEPMRLPPWLTVTERDSIGRSSLARSAVEANLAAMVVCRRRADFRAAARYQAQLSAIRVNAEQHRPADVADLALIVLIQSAVLSDLNGDSEGAVAQFGEAYRHAAASAYGFGAAELFARMAVSLALLGQMRQALACLERASTSLPVRGLLTREVRYLTLLAEAIIATAQLDRTRAARALAAVDDALDGGEWWPFVLTARVGYVLTWGDTADLVSCLAGVRVGQEQLAKLATVGGTAGPALAGAEVDLLVALGRGNEARSVLDGGYGGDRLLAVSRARLALFVGDNRAARDFAVATIADPGPVSPLQRLRAMLVRAVASYRLDRFSEAVEAFGRAVVQSNLLAVRQPFGQLPRADLLALAVQVPGGKAILADQRPPGVPGPITLVTLSRREQVVLEQLSSGRPVATIAAGLNVSTNTVRSQARSIYRKLGVNSRPEAVRLGRQLGLVD